MFMDDGDARSDESELNEPVVQLHSRRGRAIIPKARFEPLSTFPVDLHAIKLLSTFIIFFLLCGDYEPKLCNWDSAAIVFLSVHSHAHFCRVSTLSHVFKLPLLYFMPFLFTFSFSYQHV
jgi:hypothetical protein